MPSQAKVKLLLRLTRNRSWSKDQERQKCTLSFVSEMVQLCRMDAFAAVPFEQLVLLAVFGGACTPAAATRCLEELTVRCVISYLVE